MKKLFLVLSLCLGFSVGFALDGTLQIQSVVEHPQTGQDTTINLGTHTFDVFRGARELVREVYGICQNPPAKVKTFIANRKNLGDTSVDIDFSYANSQDKSGFGTAVISCEYNLRYGKSEFESIGEVKIKKWDSHSMQNKTRPLNEIINEVLFGIFIETPRFPYNFALFIDAARAEAKAKGVSVSVPNKTITISFGSKVINDVGAESVSIYPSLDYKFNVYDDRRELWKATFNACTQLRSNILREIGNGNTNPSVSVWYEHPNGGLAELKSLICLFNDDGRYTGYYGNNSYEYQRGEIDAQSISQADIEKWADKEATDEFSDEFNKDFITRIDAANAGAKQGKKQGGKKANK